MRRQSGVIREGCVVPQKGDMRLWTMLWGGIPSTRTRYMEYTPLTGDLASGLAADVAFVRSLVPIADFHAHIGFEPLTDWRMSPDGTEQTTVFANGGQATVNFAEHTYRLRADGFTCAGRLEP
jgi:hypothetical protein